MYILRSPIACCLYMGMCCGVQPWGSIEELQMIVDEEVII